MPVRAFKLDEADMRIGGIERMDDPARFGRPEYSWSVAGERHYREPRASAGERLRQ